MFRTYRDIVQCMVTLLSRKILVNQVINIYDNIVTHVASCYCCLSHFIKSIPNNKGSRGSMVWFFRYRSFLRRLRLPASLSCNRHYRVPKSQSTRRSTQGEIKGTDRLSRSTPTHPPGPGQPGWSAATTPRCKQEANHHGSRGAASPSISLFGSPLESNMARQWPSAPQSWTSWRGLAEQK
jgi:hypothetical protein